MDEPEEEGFDISIKDIGSGTGTSFNKADNSHAQAKTLVSRDLTTSTARPRKLISTPRAAAGGGPRDIHNIDESGDGVGPLPANGPERFDRMRTTNTRTSRTTATSASSEFENRFRQDEAAFWDEEARKAKSAGTQADTASQSRSRERAND